MTQMEQLPLAAVVTHPVQDFARWKPAFDAHRRAREQAGIYAHCLNRLSPDENTVCVYFLAKNRDQLEAFFAAPGLADAMKQAGVSAPPSISLVRQVEDNTTWERPLPAAVVIHEVADFDRWKKAFDDHAPARRRAGLAAHAVNRTEENPNQVVVFLQAEDERALRAFLETAELSRAMQAAGVVGRPEIMFLRTLERVDY